MSLPQGTLRKVPPVLVHGQCGACSWGWEHSRDGGEVPARFLAGGQQGCRGGCLLVGFALAPQLRSLLLPACTDEHPPYGRLSPERGRC